MAAVYPRPTPSTTIGKHGAAPYSTSFSGATLPHPGCGNKKLLDQFRDKMRALHYPLATEKAYRHWIVEFLRFHRAGGKWRHPTDMSKAEIEALHANSPYRIPAPSKATPQACRAARAAYSAAARLVSHSTPLLPFRQVVAQNCS